MSTPEYKVGKEIKVYYQAPGATTGLTIAMDVYDEAQALVTGSSVAAMPEIGVTGRYRSSFTPDAEGDWFVTMFDSVNNTGKVVKHYEIVGHDVDDVGDQVDQGLDRCTANRPGGSISCRSRNFYIRDDHHRGD